MASQDSGMSSKLPMILAGASVAVSTTVAALAVWWASKSSGEVVKGQKKKVAVKSDAGQAASTYVEVRSFSFRVVGFVMCVYADRIVFLSCVYRLLIR